METVDVITPVVNDPFTFGLISAVNSLSDVYAMGGKPLTALAIVGFSSCDYEPAVIKEILRGAIETLDRAGAILMGGHSFEDSELKFGLSVTGTVDKSRILRTKGATPGDVIILTKPIGIGVLTTSLKGGRLKDEDMKVAVEWMLTLNDKASDAAVNSGATSATDVTGFGLLGHAYNMVRDSSVDFIIDHKAIPVLERTREMIASGMVPEGAYSNLKFLEGKIEYHAHLSEDERLLLADPQTSGGLLITMQPNKIGTFGSYGIPFSVIGKVMEGSGKIKVDAYLKEQISDRLPGLLLP